MIKRWLRRWPRAYRLLQRGYYGVRYAGERYFLGSRLNELVWRWKGVDDVGGGAADHPHRGFLVQRVGRWSPVESLLEVGCNAGPNLLALGRAYPGLRLNGVDVSARAIRAATAALAQRGLGGGRLAVGSAHRLEFPDGSVDLTLTDATLMYVGPDKIRRALAELARVARRGILLNEWHLFEPRPDGARSWWYDAHWVHDYDALLREIPRVRSVRVERLPERLWGPGGWEEHGALVEAELR